MKSGCVAKKSCTRSVIEYNSIRMNNELFTVGDVVVIKEYNDDTCYGTLVRIWKEKDKVDPMARIRWYYKPSNVFDMEYDFLSQAELLDSDHEQDIWVVCLYSKVKVFSYDEYHALDEVDDDVFFTRAKYFHKEQVVRPGLEEWKRVCVCNAIVNPDHLYVSCEICNVLYHPECIGYIEKEDQPWVCEPCSKPI
jgi:hypothetical protein